jgi:uncharacterized protein YbjT (DUF2867 family)
MAHSLRFGVCVRAAADAFTDAAPRLALRLRLVRCGELSRWPALRFLAAAVLALIAIRNRLRVPITLPGPGRVAFIDAGDIAAVAVRALLDTASHKTEHVITGPETLNYAEAAAIISDFTGLNLSHRSVSTADLVTRFVAAGIPAAFAAFLAGLDESIRHGAEDRVTSTVRTVTGRPARAFAEFVQANRGAFTA